VTTNINLFTHAELDKQTLIYHNTSQASMLHQCIITVNYKSIGYCQRLILDTTVK